MKNIWIETNAKRIGKIKRQLIEYSYAGSYGGAIPLMEVNNIIDGALVEITKMQKQINTLTAETNTLKEKLKKIESKEPAEEKDEG